MPKLTQRLIESVKPAERDLYLWDDQVPGFGLRVKPSGSKSFIVSLRIGGRGGKQRRRLIGKPSIIPVDKARQRARLMVAEAKSGIDPLAAQLAERRKLRLREVAAAFLAEHVEVKRKPSYGRECRRIFDKRILPKFGTRPLTDLTRQEITRWHLDLRDTPYQANRCLALLSRLMTWAMRHGFREHGNGNPCQYIERFRERKRERYLSAEEIRRLAVTLDAAEQAALPLPTERRYPDRRLSRFALAAIRLLLLTGARRDEIRTLRWEHVHLERGLLLLPDSKTGEKAIQLSAPAVDTLRTLPRLEKNHFVFAGTKQGAPIHDLERPWQKIRTAAGLDDVRLHDLRHTFASIGAGEGQSLPIIGKLLGHTQAATTARYIHFAADPVQKAADLIGRRLKELMRPPT